MRRGLWLAMGRKQAACVLTARWERDVGGQCPTGVQLSQPKTLRQTSLEPSGILHYFISSLEPSGILHYFISSLEPPGILHYFISSWKPPSILHWNPQAYFISSWKPPSILHWNPQAYFITSFLHWNHLAYFISLLEPPGKFHFFTGINWQTSFLHWDRLANFISSLGPTGKLIIIIDNSCIALFSGVPKLTALYNILNYTSSLGPTGKVAQQNDLQTKTLSIMAFLKSWLNDSVGRLKIQTHVWCFEVSLQRILTQSH